LRDTLPLPARDKELLAGYDSALNACKYCFGVHSETAKAFGVDVGVLGGIIAKAAVDEKLQPMLAYARKLTLTPARMTQTDADAVFARDGTRQRCTMPS
jgi:AhpD family alkylhydroperoxidase